MTASKLTSAERRLRARAAAYRLHSLYDSRQLTANARAAFQERFAHQVDPDGMLPEAERQRRAECARKEYFAAPAAIRPCSPSASCQRPTRLSSQSRSPRAIRRPVSCARAMAADLPYRCTTAEVVQPPNAIKSPSDAPARLSS